MACSMVRSSMRFRCILWAIASLALIRAVCQITNLVWRKARASSAAAVRYHPPQPYHHPQTLPNCTRCLSRRRQLALSAPTSSSSSSSSLFNHSLNVNFIPLYLKFHKVGSGAVADIFRRRCSDVAGRIAQPLPRRVKGARGGGGGGRGGGGGGSGSHYYYPWLGDELGSGCGRQGPHSHKSLAMYRAGGAAAFEFCTEQSAPVRLYTVLVSGKRGKGGCHSVLSHDCLHSFISSFIHASIHPFIR